MPKISLEEWVRRSGIQPTTPTTETGAISVVIDHYHLERQQLWRLTDYKVSSVAGVVVWLTPVKEQTLVQSLGYTCDSATCPHEN